MAATIPARIIKDRIECKILTNWIDISQDKIESIQGIPLNPMITSNLGSLKTLSHGLFQLSRIIKPNTQIIEYFLTV